MPETKQIEAYQFQPGQSGNPSGRPKGRRSLATIIRELEDEQFDWDRLPFKNNPELQNLVSQLGPMGSPFRAMVYRAMLDSVVGKPAEKASAREWLRKAGYGDKLDITTDGEKIQSPLIISTIKPREDAQPLPETETTEGH